MPLLWGMTELSLNHLNAAAARILEEIGNLSGDEDTLELQRLEHCARGLCGQLKAFQELEAHNQRQTQKAEGQKYTRYEDLPPLMPEDRDRLKEELIHKLSPKGTGTPKPRPSGLS